MKSIKSNLFAKININKDTIRAFIQENAIIISFFALFVILCFSSDAFLSSRNVKNIFDQASQVGIIACGMTLTIISGGFDLSVGAIYAISGVTASVVANAYGTPFGYLSGAIVGLLFGLFNGVLIAKLRINSFIATMASSLIIKGFGLLMVAGKLIVVNAPNFDFLGRGSLVNIRMSVILFAMVIILTGLILKRTTFGRYIIAVGGNSDAASLSGINVHNIRITTFGINGLCAGIAGVLAASRISTGLMDVGSGLELAAISAVVIGGTSVMGGQGAIWRSVLGVLLLRIITNGFNILTIQPFYQLLFEGFIIIFAVAVETLTSRKK